MSQLRARLAFLESHAGRSTSEGIRQVPDASNGHHAFREFVVEDTAPSRPNSTPSSPSPLPADKVPDASSGHCAFQESVCEDTAPSRPNCTPSSPSPLPTD